VTAASDSSSSLEASPPLQLKGLSRSYGERAALDGVTLTVRPGELFGLLGPNGSGKTTLFRVVSTLIAPSAGSARVLGHELPSESIAVRRGIGVVFQSTSLDVHLTVRENLVHQGHLYGLRGATLATAVSRELDRVGMAERARDRVGELSGGQKRRVELAKGLLHGPRLLLLDEPTNGLDPAARRDLWDHLSALRGEGVASLVTTHLMEEAERCDRVAILDRGQLVALGSPHELRSALPGEVVTVEPRAADRVDALRDALAAALDMDAKAVGGVVRLRTTTAANVSGADLVTRILADFDADVASVSVGRPTLEDVFLERTGRAFE